MPIPTQTAAVESGRLLLADIVYERLMAVIVSGELAPGEVVREEEIGAWLSVSRTPVRDAMRRLGDQDLLTYQPNRGSRVAPLDPDHLRDVLDVVATLSAQAAGRAADRLSAADLALVEAHVAQAVAAHDQGEGVERAVELDAALDVLLERAGNRVLSRTVHAMRPHVDRLLGLLPGYPGTDVVRERTDAFVAALRTSDPEVVRDAVRGLVTELGQGLTSEAVRRGLAV
ncbi:GntR family transcriptional regulator [Cellulomonas palmilytica]|uniref:GntR family transcriptional regulator n=1 Tax=Cellulomonas palmilytica TaxID=2608402 RepID=UPI001F2A7386|nr:GntR family transcriptional regulator [Cellulomonas palmilytica]UJP40770.1 GntR family transcriptional regulator [Cellulomonas palmilytica]